MKTEHKINNIDIPKEAWEAEKRVRKHVRETPVEYSPCLSQSGDCKAYLKLENLQLSGSFKLRGCMNKLLSLDTKEKEKGVITASTGNHAAAFAYATQKLGLKGTIYLPENASQTKIEALRFYDVDLKFYETDCVKTEGYAREVAEKSNLTYISPYNDIKTVGGQATIGIELEQQIHQTDSVLVPVGGGSLVAGIAGFLKSINKNVDIIGCQPVNSAVMYESVKAGKILDMESLPTISDGSAGGIEKGAITFDICKKFIDDFVLVTEEEIKEAIKLILEKHYLLIEGAAALSVASFIKDKKRYKNKNVVLIISGSKISLEILKEVLC
ncbi:MAG: threonine/serine dehydratase [Candidatus Aminicenantes bacterium]|nr:MAG: threonine/serine dehydratase [Candidatus Aminicenantes bacterium]